MLTKTVSDSSAETVHIVRPNHLNGANRLFGGIMMQWMDEVAGIVAKRHSMSNVTTASVDNLTFLHGAYQNETVVISGKVTWVGTSSMEVTVDAFVENISGKRELINIAHFIWWLWIKTISPFRFPVFLCRRRRSTSPGPTPKSAANAGNSGSKTARLSTETHT